jgi:hypothetical protein
MTDTAAKQDTAARPSHDDVVHPKTARPGVDFDPHQSNQVKDPDDWVTGEERMTGAQASYLKTLCEEADEEFDAGLSKAEASREIDRLQEQVGRGTATARHPG